MNANTQTRAAPGAPSRLSPKLVLGVFLVLLAAAPLVLPEFYVTLLNYVGLSALVALGLVLLTGVGGLTSFGQAAFVGLGGYTTAWLTTSPELPGVFALIGGSPWPPWSAPPSPQSCTAGATLVWPGPTPRAADHFSPHGRTGGLGMSPWGVRQAEALTTLRGQRLSLMAAASPHPEALTTVRGQCPSA